MPKQTMRVLLHPSVALALEKQAAKERVSLSELLRRIVTRSVHSGEYRLP